MQPCENERKETFWLLAINGVSTAGGNDIVPPILVPVDGMHGPPSEEDQPHRAMQRHIHVFWSCLLPSRSSSQKYSVGRGANPFLSSVAHAPRTGDLQRSTAWCVYNTQQWRPRTLAVVAGVSHDSPECMGDT